MANAPSKNVKSVTRWTPNPSPAGEDNLSDYLYSELNRLSDTLINIDLNRIEETHTDPASSDGKPRSGDIRYADGTNWDPLGEGKGLYIYDGSAWKNLVNQDISSITITSGNDIIIQNGGDILIESGGNVTVQSGGSLTVDSGATITNNGTGSGFGKIVNVWKQSDSTPITTNSQTWQDTTISFSVTPKSSTNVIVWFMESSDKGTTAAQSPGYRILLNGAQVGDEQGGGSGNVQSTMYWFRFGVTGIASTVTAKLQFRAQENDPANAYHYWAEMLALEVEI